MTRQKGSSGPSMFAEWVIGTSLQSYMPKTKPKPKKRRDVIRVEVTTDDESEADILTITYPRPQHWSAKEKDAAKKVRFEENPKSALKQNKNDATSDKDKSASETAVETDTATESESESNNNKKNNAKGNGKKGDDEPHPHCKCSKCVSGREKQKQQKDNDKKEAESDGDSTDSCKKPAGKSKKSKKKQDKDKDKVNKSDTDASASEAENSDKKETKETKTKDGDKSDKAKSKADESKNGDKKDDSKKDDKKADKEAKDTKPNKDTPGSLKKKTEQTKYPEAYPFYHPRLPNLIGPIRAQVVQTEPVVETAEDPPPNAFYDAQHNIMRVYHGPVYGNHFSRSLYPMRDAAGRPLPIGMPHPTQNPYLYGFKQPGGAEHQPAWPQAVGYPPNNVVPAPAPAVPAPQPAPQQQPVASPTGSKGAFSKSPPNQADDIAGQNNVGPEQAVSFTTVTETATGCGLTRCFQNPYYSTKQTKSVFSDMGSDRHGSPQAKSNSQNGNSLSNGNGHSTWDNNQTQPNTQEWTNANVSPEQNAQWNQPANAGGGWDNNNPASNEHNGHYNDNNNSNNNNGGGAWDNADAGNNASTWDNGQSGTQDMPPQSDQQWDTGQPNNVGPMPGSWNDVAQNQNPTNWQDSSMAATTNGKIDMW